ncbi:MAG: STAS domain-containing protein [bacterium]|nr:STAS domain-containing protein [bacterium]
MAPREEKVKVMILRLDRDISLSDMERIWQIISRYRSRGYTFSILDLGAVHHVDFLGLKRLSRIAEEQRASGGRLALSGISGYLATVFQGVGVYEDFQHFTTSSSGIHAIRTEHQVTNLDIAVIHGKNLATVH